MKMNPNEWKLKSFIAMGQCGTMWKKNPDSKELI